MDGSRSKAAELQIYLFGGLELRLDGAPLTAFVSSKVPALLAYLAVTGRSHARDSLAALLWGEMSDADARNNLRQALSNLRKLVGEHLLISRDNLSLDPAAPVLVDVTQFEGQLKAARGQPPAPRAAHLEAATDIYMGDFLAGFSVRDAPEFEAWALTQRTRLHELALHALHSLTEHYLERGQFGRAIDSASRLLALDPWREEAHRQLMLALARSGQRSAALAQYQTCRQVLEKELAVAPSAATTTLFQRIKAAGMTPAHNLPPQPTTLIGRSAELALIETRLRQPDSRLITLVGAGGSGKTRLALEAARRALEMGLFLNGVFLVNLASVPTPDLVAPAIADALNLTLGGPQEPGQQLAAHLRERETLLLLDNMEHLLDVAGWLVQLLQRAPGIKLLATSRARLNVQWEWSVPLDGLDYPPTANADDLSGYAAMQLFMTRAQAARPALSLDPTTLACMARICRLVAGMPLGLELAAASLHHFSCAEIAEGIGRNLDFLAAHYRDTPPRHHSLRAAFDHSWRLLTPLEQTAFARLSVFQGSFEAAAATAIGVSPHLLAALADKSLLQRLPGGRYGLHELLRQFAAERLVTLSDQTVVERHSHYYLGWMSQQIGRLKGRGQKEALVAVSADYDNIRAAWQNALDQRSWERLAPAVESFYYFFLLRSRLTEGVAAFEAGRRATAGGAEPACRRLDIHLTNITAKLLISLSRVAEARPLLERSLAALAVQAADELEAAARRYYGSVLTTLGELESADGQFARSRDLARRLGDGWAEANTLIDWARLAFVRKQIALAEERCRAGLALAEQSGELLLIANFLTALSILRRESGDLAGAEHFVQRSLPVYADMEDTYGLVQGHLTLGALLLRQARYAEATALFEQALHGSRMIGFGWGEADALWRLGQAAAGEGDRAVALAHWRTALAQSQAIQETELIRDILFDVAGALAALGQAGPAADVWGWLCAQADAPDLLRAMAEAQLRGLAAETRPSPQTIKQWPSHDLITQILDPALRRAGIYGGEL